MRRPLPGRRATTTLAVVTALALSLSACGSDSDDDSTSSSGSTSDSGIVVSGAFGEKPTIEVPDEAAPDELVVEVIEEGDGAEVVAGDILVADYLGQTWEPTDAADPNVFDNSFDRGEPAGFGIGTGAVIPGWDEGLVGQTVGSRVLLTIPPDQGYGDQDQESIPAGSTLVFVVDIVNAINGAGAVSGTPVADLPADLPTVEGDGAETAPTVTFPAGAPEPATSDATVLIAGDGDELGKNLVVKILQVAWGTGAVEYSSWEQEKTEQITADQLPGLGDVLSGQKVGTRALIRVAAADAGQAAAPLVLVVDIIGTY